MFLVAVKVTGPVVHVICGILLTILVAEHLFKRICVLSHMRKGIQLVDWVLIITLAIMFLSGMLLHPMGDIMWMKLAHKLSSVIFMVFVIVHSVQHVKR